MRIDKRLNLIISIYDDEDEAKLIAHVHSTPLARETVEKNFLLLGQTFAAIYNQGLGKAAGPATSMLLLRQIAQNTGIWEEKDGSPGSGKLLVDEIKRLTTVIIQEGGSWQQVPLDVAVARKFLNDDDRSEVENAIVFFIVNYALLPRRERRAMIEGAAELWGAQLSFSTPSDFQTSLKTSKGTASSGEKSPAPAPSARVSANATVDGKPASVPH